MQTDPLQYIKGRQRQRAAAVGLLPAPDALFPMPGGQPKLETPHLVKAEPTAALAGSATQQPTSARAGTSSAPVANGQVLGASLAVTKQEAVASAAVAEVASAHPSALDSGDGPATKKQRLGEDMLRAGFVRCLR